MHTHRRRARISGTSQKAIAYNMPRREELDECSVYWAKSRVSWDIRATGFTSEVGQLMQHVLQAPAMPRLRLHHAPFANFRKSKHLSLPVSRFKQSCFAECLPFPQFRLLSGTTRPSRFTIRCRRCAAVATSGRAEKGSGLQGFGCGSYMQGGGCKVWCCAAADCANPN
eukprot:5681901-Pleurochrysis_carterae.AAC.1